MDTMDEPTERNYFKPNGMELEPEKNRWKIRIPTKAPDNINSKLFMYHIMFIFHDYKYYATKKL